MGIYSSIDKECLYVQKFWFYFSVVSEHTLCIIARFELPQLLPNFAHLLITNGRLLSFNWQVVILHIRMKKSAFQSTQTGKQECASVRHIKPYMGLQKREIPQSGICPAPCVPCLFTVVFAWKCCLFCLCAHGQCRIYYIYHVEFHFRFRHLVSFPV